MEAKHLSLTVYSRWAKRIALGLCLIVCLTMLTNHRKESYVNEMFITNTKRSRMELDLKNRSSSTADPNKPTEESPVPVVHSKEDLKAINAYLKEQEQFCNASMRNKTGQNWCPCIPPNLKGRLVIDTRDSSWEVINEAVGKDIDVGGEWRPPNCVSHTRLAVIIPCRDRDMHLRVLLRHLIPILQRQLVEFRIFVTDQSFPLVFNKASTMNIGFLEAMKRFKFNCVMFHDVDHLLEDDRVLMNCGPVPHHYAIGVKKWGYRLIYGGFFGGVVTLTPEMFTRVNGYSNKFFGWGSEDDDMWSRVRNFWKVYRPPIQIARYSTVEHSLDSLNPRNNKRMETMSQQSKNYKNKTFDGLTDLKYAITNIAITNLFTKFKANIDITNLPYHFKESTPARYTKHKGVCLNQDNISGTKDVSKVTCQYVCDHPTHGPCFGFSYRPDGQAARCSLLSTACHLTTGGLGATYVKHVGRSV